MSGKARGDFRSGLGEIRLEAFQVWDFNIREKKINLGSRVARFSK